LGRAGPYFGRRSACEMAFPGSKILFSTVQSGRKTYREIVRSNFASLVDFHQHGLSFLGRNRFRALPLSIPAYQQLFAFRELRAGDFQRTAASDPNIPTAFRVSVHH